MHVSWEHLYIQHPEIPPTLPLSHCPPPQGNAPTFDSASELLGDKPLLYPPLRMEWKPRLPWSPPSLPNSHSPDFPFQVHNLEMYSPCPVKESSMSFKCLVIYWFCIMPFPFLQFIRWRLWVFGLADFPTAWILLLSDSQRNSHRSVICVFCKLVVESRNLIWLLCQALG